MKHLSRLILLAGAVAAGAALGTAQIERLTLEQMVAKTDNAVIAEITGSRVFRVDHPVDGPELYYTTLTLAGTSLADGKPITVDVTFPGGFISDTEGVHNSEAPSADDIRVGNQIVAFYRWTNNMGGDVAANALYASHGGLFRTVAGPTGTVVLGRGEGYAVDTNKSLGSLKKAVQSLVEKR
ncbi:MAG: hypothetical protein AAF682_17055 [Planctomycetota bacterium]